MINTKLTAKQIGENFTISFSDESSSTIVTCTNETISTLSGYTRDKAYKILGILERYRGEGTDIISIQQDDWYCMVDLSSVKVKGSITYMSHDESINLSITKVMLADYESVVNSLKACINEVKLV